MDENKNLEFPLQPDAPDYTARGREFIFGTLVLVLAMVTCNCALFGGFNLGFGLGAAGLTLCSGWYLRASGVKFGRYEKALVGFALAIALGYARSAEGMLKFGMFFLLLGSVNLALVLAAGQNRRSPDRAGSLLDAFRGLFSLGIGGTGSSAAGLSKGLRQGGTAARRFEAVTTGLLISGPVLAVMVFLLMRADAAFEGVMDLLPSFEMEELIHTLLWGGILGWILYSRGLRLVRDRKPEAAPEKPGKTNPLTVNTVLIMVDLVYVVYLASQLAYLSGGLSGILPEAYTLAQYARRGFFEMAWLGAINLSILCFAMHTIQREDSLGTVTKISGTFLGGITIFLVLTASAKMLLYIGSYGLTQLRVLTEVFMLWLAVTTVLVTLRLFRPQLPYMQAVVLTGLALATLVFWLDVSTLTANYNLRAYQSGKLETIDVSYLDDLGAEGIPALIALTKDADPEISQMAKDVLEHAYYSASGFREWNFAQAVAADAWHEYKYGK